MPADVALIRAYRRPELLWWCLGHFSKAVKPSTLIPMIWIDSHHGAEPDPAVYQMACDIQEDMTVDVYLDVPHDHTGDSFAFLSALKWALACGAERIYNIEEDVLIAPDFFRWHQAAHALGDFSVTVASNKLHDPRVCGVGNPEHVFESDRGNAVGACFSREFAENLVIHAVPEYYHSFATMQAYLDVCFPETKGQGDLQWDGLMRRIFERENLKALYPVKPRAYHCGWYGQNREVNYKYPDESLEAKIKHAGEIIFSNEQLQQMSSGKPDCQVFPLEEVPWQRLSLIP